MKWKIATVLVVVLGLIAWLAGQGNSDSPQASMTRFALQNYAPQKERLAGKPVILMGFVKEGTVKLRGERAYFTLTQDKADLPVYYNGQDGLPDTFEAGSQALLEGYYSTKEKRFQADKITTKCASKYNKEMIQ